MKHEQVQDSFFLYTEGLLERSQQSEIDAHLEACDECRVAFQRSAGVLDLLDELATDSHRAPAAVTVTVMERIRESRGRTFSFSLQRHSLAFATLAGLILTISVLFAPKEEHPTFHSVGQSMGTSSAGGGGGPTGSYSQAQYDDTLIRNSVGNLFVIIEGAFGALFMVGSFILGAIFIGFYFRRKERWLLTMAYLLFATGAAFLVVRQLVSIFFGPENMD